MATRFRLPASGAAAVSPAVQSYTHTATTRRPLPLTDSTALATQALAPDAADHLVAGDQLFAQFVSAALSPQTLASGLTVKLQLQALEAHLNNNLFLQLWLGVYDNAGTTLAATLRAKVADATELIATIQNRALSTTTTAGYTCTGGERLVAEISVVGTPGPAAGGIQGHNASLRFGSNGAGGDLAENDTEAGATFNPWLELSADLLFQSDPGGIWTGLISYWKLEETSGTRADTHGISALTDTNTVGSTTGKIGTAASHVASADEYFRSTSAALTLTTTDSWSVSLWAYVLNFTNYRNMFNGDVSGDGKQCILATQTSGQLWRWSSYNSGVVLSTGVWTHIVYTFSSGGVNTGTEQFYVNGSALTSRTGAVPAPTTAIRIGGGFFSTDGWDGYLDEIAYFRRAITSTEVASLYNAGAGLQYPNQPAGAGAPFYNTTWRRRVAA